jgi:outer membrane protein, multidrug efflux system
MRPVPVLILGIVFYLGGCAMIPKYTRPKPPVPAVLPGKDLPAEGKPGQEVRTAVNLRWQDIFPDQKLQKTIELALLNNRDLRIAVLNAERSRALYGIQRAELFPSLTASAEGSEQRVPANLSGTGKTARVKQYSVDLGIVAWEIDLFGRIRSLKEQALQEYLGTEEARRGAQVTLISEVAKAYLTFAADQQNLGIAKSTLEAQRGVYGVIWQQYDKGIVTEVDLQRSQTQVDTASRDVARYTQFVEEDRNALELLVGAPVPQDFLPSDLSNVIPLKDIPFGLSSEVLFRRPDIMAAEHGLRAAYAFVGAARAVFFPQISLTSVIGTASSDLSNLFGPGSKAWTYIPAATMPIFDMRTYAAYRVSKADRDLALAQYEKTIQTAFREVADALAVRGMIDQEVAAEQSIVDSGEKIYRLSKQRYDQGIDGYLSVLDAQRSLYLAQRELTLLQLSKFVNQVKFYTVLGGDGEL